MAVAQSHLIGTSFRPPPASGRVRALRVPDPFDLAVLLAFVALSLWILALYLVRVVGHGHPWLGTDGPFVSDQAMYLAWIRDASHHVLISDLYALHPTPRDFLQPAILISAGLVRLGVAPWVALVAWQPVAVAGVFFAVRALTRRLFNGTAARRVALVAALFGGSIGTYIFPDLWIPWWSWGYPFALIALAAAIGSLIVYESARRTWLATLLAGLASWMHPWIGEILVLILVSSEAAMWLAGKRPRFARLAAVLVGAALPLAYYGALSLVDESWRVASKSNSFQFSIPLLAFMLAPLLAPAVLAYRLRPRTFIQVVVRMWPPAAFAVFWLAEHGLGTWPTHAYLGISVPLALLAVEGLAALPRPPFVTRPMIATLAALATLAVIVPVTISSMKDSATHVRDTLGVTNSEWRALAYLARDPEPGGVLTSGFLSMLTAAETGRNSYGGNGFWSPPNPNRDRLVSELLADQLRPRRARAFVLANGVRFVLEGCGSHRHRLTRELRPLIRYERRFGCATLYALT